MRKRQHVNVRCVNRTPDARRTHSDSADRDGTGVALLSSDAIAIAMRIVATRLILLALV